MITWYICVNIDNVFHNAFLVDVMHYVIQKVFTVLST